MTHQQVQERELTKVRAARPSSDGDGVRIQRVAGMQDHDMDPILMIDELRSQAREDFMGGFPPHPHKGMQTLTYMKAGGIIHEDNQGNRGEIRGGGAQWMSAGRGIIHSEMPTQDTTGLHGFQLWVNLAAADKMDEPRYRDIPAAQLAALEGPGYKAVAIAGDWHVSGQRARGPLVELESRAAIMDLSIEPGGEVVLATPEHESVMAYIYKGGLAANEEAGAQSLVITGPGEQWRLRADSAGMDALILRGQPLREPVAHYGPFVMNTAAEIERAIQDYQTGQFA